MMDSLINHNHILTIAIALFFSQTIEPIQTKHSRNNTWVELNILFDLYESQDGC
jgi:hypothetical protein